MSRRLLALTAWVLLAPAVARGATWFERVGRSVGGATPALPTPAYLSASRIAAVDDGALVIDGDSGALVRTDRAGAAIAQLTIGPAAGPLTFDPATRRAYVVDRRADHVVVVAVDDGLGRVHTWTTPAEPVAAALVPRGTHLLVVAAADRALVALDVRTGREAWRAPLGAEPRGLAVSPDGTRALVTYVTAGAVDTIDLATHAVTSRALVSPPATPARVTMPMAPSKRPPLRRRTPPPAPRRFARGAFAALFLGADLAVVPFQTETPVGVGADAGSYGGGGGGGPSIEHHLATLGFAGARPGQAGARITVVAPRALAWDGVRDALYVAGIGADRIVQVTAASQQRPRSGLAIVVTPPAGGPATVCGPEGLAVAPDGDLLVWCALARQVVRVDVVAADGAWATPAASGMLAMNAVAAGPVLAPSSLTAEQHAGLELFQRASRTIAGQAGLACVSCHPDGRADGLSWRIGGHTLQTPVLAGRIVGTHPYKWDGGDPTLVASLTGTIGRLGGTGLTPVQTAALAAYVEALPAARTPTRDPATVARGEAVFDRVECRTCHDGAAYTDAARYRFKGTLKDADTPSLRGLAVSAPYYHDGSAATLEALVRGGGKVHGMADTRGLTDAEVTDLVAFLETR